MRNKPQALFGYHRNYFKVTVCFLILLPLRYFYPLFYCTGSYCNKIKAAKLLIVASYTFILAGIMIFFILLVFSTFFGLLHSKLKKKQNETTRKFWFWLSITVNLGLLGVLNITISLLAPLLINAGRWLKSSPFFGCSLASRVSFYTFHGLSYIIDIYYKRIIEYNFVDYSLFVSYFPLLVAGPIERPLTYCKLR
jgi:D-alanyl-lipoteichoic acid acyltransferase DltB (MBOAT superfamily)